MAGYYQADYVLEADIAALSDLPDVHAEPSFAEADMDGAGCETTALRAMEPRDSGNGTDVSSWLYDYYYRLWVIPARQDFGTVTSVTDKTVGLWNTFFDTFAWQSLDEADSAGLSWPGLSLPQSLAPMGYYTFTHRASADGPLDIDARYRIVGDLGGANYRATGARGMIFAWEPDWSRPVRVASVRRSRVETSIAGPEARADMGERALFRVRWEVLARDAREGALLRMAINRAKTIGLRVPIWPDVCYLTAQADPGDTVLYVDDESGRRFREGGHVMLFASHDEAEAREISAVATGSIELSEPLVGTWAADTAVMPCVGGYLTRWPDFAGITDECLRGALEVEETITL